MAEAVQKAAEEFEIIDSANSRWLQQTFKDLTKASASKQIVVGGLSGWCAGYLFGNVSRPAALALGGGLLLLQIAHHQGYIAVNWGKLEKKMKKARRQLTDGAKLSLPTKSQEVANFVQENVVLTGSFAGGLLIGLAW